MSQTVEAKSPGEIRAAIWCVRLTRTLRTKAGFDAFESVLLAPQHSMTLTALEAQHGAINLHLGWLCRHVAYKLGIEEPDEFELFDHSLQAGRLLLKVKPCVVAALTT